MVVVSAQFEKYAQVKLHHSPNFQREHHKKYTKVATNQIIKETSKNNSLQTQSLRV